jgi:hypothetical protein
MTLLLQTGGACDFDPGHLLDGGGVFDLDNRDGVTLTATRVTAAGPLVAEIADALAGRPPAAALLGGLPASSRAALSRMADFFNTPAGPGPA